MAVFFYKEVNMDMNLCPLCLKMVWEDELNDHPVVCDKCMYVVNNYVSNFEKEEFEQEVDDEDVEGEEWKNG